MTLRQRAFVPVLLFVGAVVSIISSLGAPLIPELASELGQSLSNTQWALTATLVVAAVASPLVGRLGDGRHRKHVIVGSLSLVVLGGALAALATSLGVLIVGRALQGLGLALMPLTMAAARQHLPREKAGRTIAALSVVGAAGVGLGYPITGFIADHGGVHTAYWFGTAVSVLALVAATWAIPNPDHPAEQRHIDYAGAAIIGAGLVALLVALDKGADWGWGAPQTPSLLVAGLVLLAVWARHELRTTEPLVDLRLMRHRAVLTANVTGLLLGVTMYLSMVTMTQFIQLDGFGFGQTVFVAGLALVPLSVMSASVSRTLPALEARFGIRPIIPAGALAVAAASLFFGLTADHLWQAFVTTGILGIGLGYTFAAMPGLIVGAVPPEETGSAMGFYQVSRFVGFALGSGLAITLLRAFGDAGEPTLGSYHATALIGCGLAVATAVIAWVLPGRAPATPVRSEALGELEREEGLLAAAGLEDLEERDDPRRTLALSRH
ncbi:MAG: MFS transporter [Solirubrobacteraceae bacterium]|nr:MFS transporter [Solirubrobacteraceae bacterium]